MANDVNSATIPAEALRDVATAVENALKGVRDPQARRRARERMDRLREEFRRRNGEVNLAVDLIHEVRDEL